MYKYFVLNSLRGCVLYAYLLYTWIFHDLMLLTSFVQLSHPHGVGKKDYPMRIREKVLSVQANPVGFHGKGLTCNIRFFAPFLKELPSQGCLPTKGGGRGPIRISQHFVCSSYPLPSPLMEEERILLAQADLNVMNLSDRHSTQLN